MSPFGFVFVVGLLLYMFIVEPILELIVSSVEGYILDKRVQKIHGNRETATEVKTPCKQTVWEHHTKDGKEWWIRRVIEDDDEQQITQELRVTQKSNES